MHKPLLVLLALLPAPAQAAQAHLELPRADGTSIHYSLDVPATATPAGMVVLLSGSGCLPGAVNHNIALARAAFPHHTALIVEKAGVTPDAPVSDGSTDCPAPFHAGHTVSQRVDDIVAVLDHLRGSTPAAPLVLFGGSEGGLAVAVLTTRVPADAAILLSTGTGISFEDLVLSTVPPEGQAQVSAGFAAARADPEGLDLLAGFSHRFWADILQHGALDAMLATDTPFLLIQGGLDTASPLAAARLTADRFAAEGRCNLTYWELPALDHGMRDPAGMAHMADILAMAAHWTAAPKPAC